MTTGQVPPPPPSPRLYTFRRCPYAMRARMALLQAGRAFEAVEVNLREKPASLRALSPKATVPVLHLPDGRVIEESWDIMRWALAEPDLQGWWARAQSADNQRWCSAMTATSSATWTAGSTPNAG